MVTTGAVVSTMVISCTQLAIPQVPVAVHVRVITPVLPQAAANASLKLTLTPVPFAVAVPVFEGAVELPHSTDTSGGQNVIAGDVQAGPKPARFARTSPRTLSKFPPA